MKTTAKLVRLTFVGSGAVALLLGLIIWTRNGARLIPIHELLGYVLFISLWIIAAVATRSGVPGGIVALAAAWGLVGLILAVAQKELLPGNWHWTIRVLHAASGIGAIAWGERLAIRMRQNETVAPSSPRLTIKEAATEFLAQKRIAVTGVSKKPEGHGSNTVYQRLRQRNYKVFAVNPNADQVEGDRCFHDLKSIPGGVEAVLIGTRLEHAMATMHECADLGIKHVWMHRSFGAGSVSDAAAAWGREHASG
jgi:predicted CoA-binding protein